VFGYGKDWIPNDNEYLGNNYLEWAKKCQYYQNDPDFLVKSLLDAVKPTPHFDLRELWDKDAHVVLDSNYIINQRIEELKKTANSCNVSLP
jgi:hypothetical protein